MQKDHRGIQSLRCLGSPTLQHELKENLKVTEQVGRPPPVPLSSTEPHKYPGCCSKALWSLNWSTCKTCRISHSRSGSMRNQVKVFPKYPHILKKDKLVEGQLNSTSMVIFTKNMLSLNCNLPPPESAESFDGRQNVLSRIEVLYTGRV